MRLAYQEAVDTFGQSDLYITTRFLLGVMKSLIESFGMIDSASFLCRPGHHHSSCFCKQIYFDGFSFRVPRASLYVAIPLL